MHKCEPKVGLVMERLICGRLSYGKVDRDRLRYAKTGPRQVGLWKVETEAGCVMERRAKVS